MEIGQYTEGEGIYSKGRLTIEAGDQQKGGEKSWSNLTSSLRPIPLYHVDNKQGYVIHNQNSGEGERWIEWYNNRRYPQHCIYDIKSLLKLKTRKAPQNWPAHAISVFLRITTIKLLGLYIDRFVAVRRPHFFLRWWFFPVCADLHFYDDPRSTWNICDDEKCRVVSFPHFSLSLFLGENWARIWNYMERKRTRIMYIFRRAQ